LISSPESNAPHPVPNCHKKGVRMYRALTRRRQRGAVIITVALLMLFLLGFMGFALDFGHLFVVKTELQTAMDSCALAAAQELDGHSDAQERARSAGKTAGNLNRVNMQSATWSGMGQIIDADITFMNADYVATASGTAAKYVQCQHTQAGIPMWLIKAMGAFSGSPATYPATQNVAASAVATRASAQATCPLPLALKPKDAGDATNYGFAVGEWVTLLHDQSAVKGGDIGWANLDGSKDAAETKKEMNGHCGTRVGDTLGTPGVEASIAEAWNARFGIYKEASGPDINHPDFTGYSYTKTNWKSEQNAYDDFVAKRGDFANCAANTGTDVSDCASITGLKLGGGFQTLATSGPTGQHHDYGTNRRLATVPVVNDAMQVVNYACMLLLQPMPIPMDDVKLEYRGNAGAEDSPCAPSGIPGGTTGPLVPVLVR
jgi:Flp pilus assembly protein TadG